jgi:hypothetical protein
MWGYIAAKPPRNVVAKTKTRPDPISDPISEDDAGAELQ